MVIVVKFHFRLYFFEFVITAAGVVPCGGPKKYTRTSSIMQLLFYFWPFETIVNILRIRK